MNQYFTNLNKIEFVVTNACTGKCKHCSAGGHHSSNECIDAKIAADAVKKIAENHDIKTVMTFGGEPLLYPEVVYEIMSVATELCVPRRQVITNGYFSKSPSKICEVAEMLAKSGVNDLRLSVDAFHQETIPLDIVKQFARELKKVGVPTTLQPAWLVSREHDNPYNKATREILDSFSEMNLPIGDGNIIFPEGNALKYLGEYFADVKPENPYVENPFDVRCISFSQNGDVLDGNIYKNDIIKIMNDYSPEEI